MGVGSSNRGRSTMEGTSKGVKRHKIEFNPEALSFVFPEEEISDPNNGLCLNEVFFPEEILILIFSHVPVANILKLGLVCKKWYNLMKTYSLWSTIYFRQYNKLPKHLPWYTIYAAFEYFDINLLKNNCGRNKFNNWTVLSDGTRFKIEDTPVGCDPYPKDCPDFNGAKSCFVTSYMLGLKVQDIPLKGNLINYIINKHKPHIYISEWVAGRFDCGGCYILEPALYSSAYEMSKINNRGSDDEDYVGVENFSRIGGKGMLMQKSVKLNYAANEAIQWRKMEVLFEDYPSEVMGVLFIHKAKDNQFWAGYYGPKMAGGTVKLLFNTMKEEEEEEIFDD